MPLQLISSPASLLRVTISFALPAGDHHHDAADRLGIAALDHGAVANLFAELHIGHVTDVDRGAARLP